MVEKSKENKTINVNFPGSGYGGVNIILEDGEGFKELSEFVQKEYAPNHDKSLYMMTVEGNGYIPHIIFDFDSEDIKESEREVNIFSDRLKVINIPHTIVFSGKKGYHLYIHVNGLYVDKTSLDIGKVVKNNYYPTFGLKTLDERVQRMGLKHNIRIPGTIHPDTGKKCEVVYEYIPETPDWNSYTDRYEYAKADIMKRRTIDIDHSKRFKNGKGVNILDHVKVISRNGDKVHVECPMPENHKHGRVKRQNAVVFKDSEYKVWCPVCGSIYYKDGRFVNY